MANTITILNKEFIKSNELEELAKNFALQKGLLMEYERENKINIWHGTDEGSAIGIIFGITEEEFNSYKGTYSGYEDYSDILLMSYFNDDQLLIPFLKELIKPYPDVLVYNDETRPSDSEKHYTVHSKEDIESVNDNDYWSLLGK